MRYVVLFYLCLCAVIAYMQRLAISVPARRIEAEFGLDDAGIGFVIGAWYLGYAIFQLPSGWLADRIGSKWSLVVFCTAWSILTGLVGVANTFPQLVGLWFLMGVAQAGVFPCATKSIGGWFPDRLRGIAVGLLIVSQLGGAAIAPRLTAELLRVPYFERWQTIFLLYAAVGISWAAAFALVTRRPPTEPVTSMPIDWGRLAGSRSMWLLIGQQFCRGAAMVFYLNLFPKFLQATAGLSEIEAGRLTSWPGLGAMVGGLLGGTVSDAILRRTGRKRLARQGVAVLGMVGCTVLTLSTFLAPDVYGLVFLFSIGAFWGTFGGISGYSVAIDFGGTRVGVVFATMNMAGNIGGSLFPPLIGLAIKETGNWNIAIYTFATLFAIDAVLWALLNPKKPLFEDRA